MNIKELKAKCDSDLASFKNDLAKINDDFINGRITDEEREFLFDHKHKKLKEKLASYQAE